LVSGTDHIIGHNRARGGHNRARGDDRTLKRAGATSPSDDRIKFGVAWLFKLRDAVMGIIH
jgi:hypothetical protein